jgi:hypothetical protein
MLPYLKRNISPKRGIECNWQATDASGTGSSTTAISSRSLPYCAQLLPACLDGNISLTSFLLKQQPWASAGSTAFLYIPRLRACYEPSPALFHISAIGIAPPREG